MMRLILLNSAVQMTRTHLNAVLFCIWSFPNRVENSHFTLFCRFIGRNGSRGTCYLTPASKRDNVKVEKHDRTRKLNFHWLKLSSVNRSRACAVL